ncbi:hypothetical protein KJZ67_03265 [Patescibacteria group bacterium]|nr:hypothetical protein [Patescibacteria group bacterium]
MMKKKLTHILLFVALLVVATVPLLDLLHPGFPVTHDGQDHVARIANFYASLAEGNVVPRWAANLNWGYGHPILMFLYPLPSYVASVFHAVGFSFIDSTKLVFAVAYVASMFFMFVWVRAAWGVAAGVTAAALYGFAPYRFVDLYVRGAIGEHIAFVFPPLICYGFLLLSREKNRVSIKGVATVTVGTTFLILGHNALSLMFLPLIALYALYLAIVETKKPLLFAVAAVSSVLSGFLLSAFYWIPAFFEGKYTLRDIVTAGEFSGRFVPWLSFLYSPWSYGGSQELSKWLGAGQLLALGAGFFAVEKNTKHQRLLIAGIFLLFFSLFFMTQNSSPIWNTVTLLQKFQFPWRIMSVAVFIISVIGGLTVSIMGKNSLKMATLIIFVAVVSTIPMWRAKEYRVVPETFFSGIYNSTTDTGESSPVWSVRFMEKRASSLAFTAPEPHDITIGPRTTTSREYTVNISKPVRFVENTLYFPGWQVFVNGDRLETEKLIFQDPNYRGLMTFDLDPGQYTLRFLFTETKLREFSNYLSLGSFGLFLLGIGTIHMLWRKRI